MTQSTQQTFPFSYDQVFDGLVRVLPASGMKIKSKDKVIGRITASTGMSPYVLGRERHRCRGEDR